jgi:hypothetical protein
MLDKEYKSICSVMCSVACSLLLGPGILTLLFPDVSNPYPFFKWRAKVQFHVKQQIKLYILELHMVWLECLSEIFLCLTRWNVSDTALGTWWDIQFPVSDASQHPGGAFIQWPYAVPSFSMDSGWLWIRGIGSFALSYFPGFLPSHGCPEPRKAWAVQEKVSWHMCAYTLVVFPIVILKVFYLLLSVLLTMWHDRNYFI